MITYFKIFENAYFCRTISNSFNELINRIYKNDMNVTNDVERNTVRLYNNKEFFSRVDFQKDKKIIFVSFLNLDNKDNVKFKILTKILLSKLEEKIPIEYLRNIDDYKVFDITFEFNIEYYNDVVNFFNEFESDEFKLLLNIEKYNL